jgi:hypothetical protein
MDNISDRKRNTPFEGVMKGEYNASIYVTEESKK